MTKSNQTNFKVLSLQLFLTTMITTTTIANTAHAAIFFNEPQQGIYVQDSKDGPVVSILGKRQTIKKEWMLEKNQKLNRGQMISFYDPKAKPKSHEVDLDKVDITENKDGSINITAKPTADGKPVSIFKKGE